MQLLKRALALDIITNKEATHRLTMAHKILRLSTQQMGSPQIPHLPLAYLYFIGSKLLL